MEKKERYEWNSRFDEAIKDNQTGDIVNAVEVLNKQDKRIKELEQETYPAYKREHQRRAYLENIEAPKLKERIKELERIAENEALEHLKLLQYDIVIKNLKQENQQLKQQLLEHQEQSIRDNQNWTAETTELQQQLKDKTKQVCEKIREWIKNQIVYCGGKANEVDILTANASNQVLDDLKQFLDQIAKGQDNEVGEK